ncbi:MAG: type I-E CRISPR-associated protein Cse1/CasA [Solobacterium sp.]|jgi:CRISPR system Cascade subunit CasA|nr:type I-E CRISPR-associated protein Cse1/CasA [Solobacterium sp.]MCH4222135.1 type I-E CRISPR-associated protein Cse1/CasA [Solobacterium sp.]
MAHFDVLNDPWIPVELSEGTHKEFGILATLKQAGKIRRINCSYPLENTAIIRLLTAFLMDAYQLENINDRKELYKQGHFDEGILDGYSDKCIAEGTSFDLFDQSAPFMQSRYDSKLDSDKETGVSAIVLKFTSGNNHTHFDHRTQAELQLSYAEALRSFLAEYTFCPAGGAGYSASVNGMPCILYVPEDEDLFKQLVLCMLAKSEIGNIPMNNPPVAWRNKNPIIPGSKTAEMSILAALTWQPRRMTLIPDEDTQTIKNVYFQRGGFFKENELWRDPFASYKLTKEGNWKATFAKEGRDLWQDVGTLTASSPNGNSKPPLILKQMGSIKPNDAIIRSNATAIIVVNNAKLVSIQFDELTIPKVFIENQELGNWLKSDIGLAERVIEKIRSDYFKPDKKEILGKEVSTEIERGCYEELRRILFTEYLPKLAEVNLKSFDWQQPMINKWDEILRTIVKHAAVKAESRAGATTEDLISIVCASNKCRNDCESIIKKGRDSNG